MAQEVRTLTGPARPWRASSTRTGRAARILGTLVTSRRRTSAPPATASRKGPPRRALRVATRRAFGGSPTPRQLPSPGSWGGLSTWGSSLPRRGPPGSPSSPRRRAAASARSVSWPRPTVSPMRLCPSRLAVVVGGVGRVLGRRDQGVRGGAVQRAVRHHDPLGCGGLVRLPSRRRTLPSSAPRPGTPRTSWPWPSGAFLPPARRRARGLWRASGTVACRSSLATPSRSSSPK